MTKMLLLQSFREMTKNRHSRRGVANFLRIPFSLPTLQSCKPPN